MIDVWMHVNLSARELFYEVPIEKFLSQRAKVDAEYREGLEGIWARKH
jgi:hypothetical protein